MQKYFPYVGGSFKTDEEYKQINYSSRSLSFTSQDMKDTVAFEVLTAKIMKIVFWVLMLCTMQEAHLFRGTYHIHPLAQRVNDAKTKQKHAAS
jgi:hypothetical protein